MKKELIINQNNSSLSIRKQCELLDLSRSSLYYKTVSEKPENLEMIRNMYKHILEEPTAGVLTMQSILADKKG
jgi:putative transposase